VATSLVLLGFSELNLLIKTLHEQLLGRRGGSV